MINENIQLYIDDVLMPKKLENNSIDLIITSPPFFNQLKIIKQKISGE